MAIFVKTEKEIEIMREGGKRHARIMRELAKICQPAILTDALENRARQLVEKEGGKAAFLGYKPKGAQIPFPAALCVSVNDEIVHGIPNGPKPKILKEGDIVSLDLGFTYKNMTTDMAVTLPVGKIDKASADLLKTTKKALYAGIKEVKAGKTTGDVGAAISAASGGSSFGIVEELAGHGVGRYVHEDPYVPNFGKAGEGEILKAGMTIAIEPMFNAGSKEIILDSDGYTYRTADGKRSAHFEHTVLVTEKGAEILTK